MRAARTLILPDRGSCLISPDLHGCLEDYRRLKQIFLTELEVGDTHWVLLGDVIHGPSAEAARLDPDLYGYRDESWAIIEDLVALTEQHPGRIHYILGNHDHGHLGGQRTARFHPDEVAALEDRLRPFQVARLRAFLDRALLAVAAPCGLLMAHASPDARLERFEDLDRVALDPEANDRYANHLLAAFLWPYGQPEQTTRRLLATVSRSCRVRVLVHGHDRDEDGWFVDGRHALCPVIFGARREDKRYLRIDLAGRYGEAMDLCENREVLRLHGNGVRELDLFPTPEHNHP